jgi:hypothetical protein
VGLFGRITKRTFFTFATDLPKIDEKINNSSDYSWFTARFPGCPDGSQRCVDVQAKPS